MSKKNVKSGKNVKKDALSDINEATKASKDILDMFPSATDNTVKKRGRPKKEQPAIPANAPESNLEQNSQEPQETEKTVVSEEQAFPADAPETSEIPTSKNWDEPKIEAETELETESEPEIEEQPPVVVNVEEQNLENWLKGRDLNNVNHFELANSGTVNFNTFVGMVEGKVGKFKFRRIHLGDNWTITIE